MAKRQHLAGGLAIFLLATAHQGAIGQSQQPAALDIKGIRIGMTRAEVRTLFPTWKSFTLAGVLSSDPRSGIVERYDDQDRLVLWSFKFESPHFYDVRDALRAKFPQLQCMDSSVKTKAGVEHTQTHCIVGESGTTLLATRFDDNIETSKVVLVDRAFLEKNSKKKQDAAANDV